jgi:hypothetical protein
VNRDWLARPCRKVMRVSWTGMYKLRKDTETGCVNEE